MSIFTRKDKTFRPNKRMKNPTLDKIIGAEGASLGSTASLQRIVKLPQNMDLNDWLADNSVNFFNQINMLYGTIMEKCTNESCPMMSAGPKYEYFWADGITYKKPSALSAPAYVDVLMTWVEEQFENPSIFPQVKGRPFPSNFKKIIGNILRRLFRIFAHIYYSHFEEIRALGEEAHLYTSFGHFVFFVREFDLVDNKELEPMKKFIDQFYK